MDLSHGIWPRPRHGLRMVGSAHGIWTEPHLAREPDELAIPEQVMPSIGSNAVSPWSHFVGDMPVRVPNLRDWVLCHDSVAEPEWLARELGTILFDFFRLIESLLHVAC